MSTFRQCRNCALVVLLAMFAARLHGLRFGLIAENRELSIPSTTFVVVTAPFAVNSVARVVIAELRSVFSEYRRSTSVSLCPARRYRPAFHCVAHNSTYQHVTTRAAFVVNVENCESFIVTYSALFAYVVFVTSYRFRWPSSCTGVAMLSCCIARRVVIPRRSFPFRPLPFHLARSSLSPKSSNFLVQLMALFSPILVLIVLVFCGPTHVFAPLVRVYFSEVVKSPV